MAQRLVKQPMKSILADLCNTQQSSYISAIAKLAAAKEVKRGERNASKEFDICREMAQHNSGGGDIGGKNVLQSANLQCLLVNLASRIRLAAPPIRLAAEELSLLVDWRFNMNLEKKSL